MLLAPLPQESGIYVVAAGAQPDRLEPAVYSAGKVTGQVLSALTSGLASQKEKAIVSGAHAAIRFTDANAEFYFVFENKSASLSNSNQWWGSLSSPNEFTLVRLDERGDHREVTTASVGAFENRAGTDEKAVISFTFTRLKAGVYRVIPRAPLLPGEYAFFPASVGGAGTAGANRLFDFGVDGR